MALQQLLYTSFIAAEFDSSWVRPIVRQARSNNTLLDITGILVFDGLRFCQYLEGPLPPLLALLERIRLDPRHIQIHVKESSPLGHERRFAGSPMAFGRCKHPHELDSLHSFKPDSGMSAIIVLEQLLRSLSIERIEAANGRDS